MTARKATNRDEAGGLSGKPLSQASTDVISTFHQEVDGRIPIIGAGGIMSPDEASAKLAAGATLLQLYTGFIYHGPKLIREILNNPVLHTSQELTP